MNIPINRDRYVFVCIFNKVYINKDFNSDNTIYNLDKKTRCKYYKVYKYMSLYIFYIFIALLNGKNTMKKFWNYWNIYR